MKTNYAKFSFNVALVLAALAWTMQIFEPESTFKGVTIGFGIVAAAMLFVAFICVIVQSDYEHENQTESATPPTNPDAQTTILPMTADVAERRVLIALRNKLKEYEDMGEVGVWRSRWYGEDLGVFGYECELDAIRKNMKDIGQDYNGEPNFCTYLTKTKKPYITDAARERHFADYFNEKCNEIAKKSLRVGLDKSLEQVLILSDYMLDDLGIKMSRRYIALKLREVEIRYHIARLKEEERQKEQEERKAQRDYEHALKNASKQEEKARLQLEKQREALEKAASEQEKIKLQEKVTTLEQKLQEALTMKERALSMAQQTRVGYVYVISNTRSFGEDVYKIGMTRRLEPMDRVRELSDASVPFAFDVHYMIYTDDAPKLESQLHQRFTDSRINADNYRKEFFRVPLTEITEVLNEIGILPNERAD